ncbi:DUF6809 family protein [Anaerotruncus rubiinfantis]|uniref:DUF6809 family protein n=1 Tax=Anaerotruncus rubiinfantis TaxID=1720200 RepID=UPI0011CBF3FC|nr:DUF6809 family protein [Anaerotruncus rubiinfantis]
MSSILEELYMGNIRPDSRIYPEDSQFVRLARRKIDSLEKLDTALNDSEKELFEQYCGIQEEMTCISRYDTYAYALRFGILLMAEVFLGNGEVSGE